MMFKIKIFLALFISIFLISSFPAWSQKKAKLITTKWADKPVVVDGLLNDWKDSLMLYNDDAKLYYSIANDDENVYLAIRNDSRESLSRILAAGISFSANIEVNKKNPPRVTFPVLDRTSDRNRNVKEQPEIEEMQKQVLSRIKEIRVDGFKEIIDGGISLYNTYGIKAAATFDANNNLVQEIAIPLRLLGLNAGSPELVTYSIRINGIQGPSGMPQRQEDDRSSMGRGMGRGMYGGMYDGMPSRNTQMNKLLSSTEFYIKSRLAIKQ